jgi:hypothetical protein
MKAEAAIDLYFASVVVAAARGIPKASARTEFFGDQAALWRDSGARPDGKPHAREIAAFLDGLGAELFGARVMAARH